MLFASRNSCAFPTRSSTVPKKHPIYCHQFPPFLVICVSRGKGLHTVTPDGLMRSRFFRQQLSIGFSEELSRTCSIGGRPSFGICTAMISACQSFLQSPDLLPNQVPLHRYRSPYRITFQGGYTVGYVRGTSIHQVNSATNCLPRLSVPIATLIPFSTNRITGWSVW